MSVGELTVSIIGDMSKLSKTFSQASAEVGKFGSSVSGLGSSMTSKVGSALSTVGTTAVVAGSALGVGLVAGGAKATSMFVDFEKSISNAASVTGLTGQAFKDAKQNISDVAQELGQKTAFSSSQAADALYNLASAGVDVSKITSSQLVPVLNLASGTQYGLAETTAAVTSTLSQFGLGFDSAGRVADVFASAAGSTQASMDKLGLSMNYVGTISNTVGMSLEDTTGALGLLYNAGMDGSTAGTSLRGVLASLVSPTDKAVGVLKNMGLTIDDVNPATNDFSAIVQTLADHGLDATEAFDIFGRESAPAILALTSKSGDLKTLTASLEEAGGAAQTMADQQLDTLAGSLDAFSGSLENLMINVGQALAPTVRSVVDSFNSMVPAIQTFVVGAVETFVGFVSQLGQSANALMAIGSTIFDVLRNIFESIAGSGAGIANSAADVINGIMSRIAGIVIEIAPIIQAAITGIIGFIKTLISGLEPAWIFLKSIASDLIDTFKAFFAGIYGAASGNAAGTISNAINSIMFVLAGLSRVVSTTLISVAPLVRSIFSEIIEILKDSIDKIPLAFVRIKTAFSELRPIFESVVTALKPVFEKLKTTWENLPETFSKIAESLKPTWDFLKELFNSGIEVFKSFVDNLGPTWDNLKSSWDSTKTIWEGMKSSIGPAISSFLDALGGASSKNASTIGEKLAGVINTLSGALEKFLKFLANNPKIVELGIAIAGVAAAFVTLVPIISGVIGVFGAISTALTGVGYVIGYAAGTLLPYLATALGALLSPVGLVVVAVAGLALAWKNNWFGIRDTANTVWTWLKTSINNVVNDLKNAYTKIISQGDTLKQQFSNAWTSIINLFSSIKSGMISAVANLASALSSSYNNIVAGVTGLLNSWRTSWNNITTATNSAGSSIASALTGLLSKIKASFTSILSAAQSLLASWKTHWSNTVSATNTAASNVASALNNLLSKAKAVFTSILSAAASLLSSWKSHWTNLVSATNTAASNVASALNSLLSKAKTAFNSILSAANSLLSSWKSVWSNIVSTVNSYASSVSSAVSGLASRIKGLASEFYSAGASIISSLSSGIESKISSIKSSINSLTSWISNNLPHSPAKEGPLSKLPNFTSYLSTPLTSAVKSATSTAKSAGSSIISSISTGIKSAASSVYKAASSALSKVTKLLPHSPAEEGPFSTLPDWDSIFYTPMLKSIKNVSGLANPLSNALSQVKSPISSGISTGLQSVQTVSNSTTVEGSKYTIGPNYVRNDADLEAIISAVKSSIANDRRRAGIF